MQLNDMVHTELHRTTLAPESSVTPIADDVSITCYDDKVPEFVGPELTRLYGSLFSSYAQFRVSGDIENASTYVSRIGNRVTSVFLFRLHGSKVRVLNELIKLDKEEVERFARYIFSTFSSATLISFHTVLPTIKSLSFPTHRSYYTDDFILKLPRTEQDYLAHMGKATRKNITHHLRRLWRTLPSAQHESYRTTDISEEHVRAIVDLNRERMAIKNKVSTFSEQEIAQIAALVRLCGMASVITIDGRVVAGAICCQVGDNYFSLVNAHDPAYDKFRLGTLCCYLAICECIKRGGREFHFLWGRYEYKYKLLGVRHNLEQLCIYRSHGHFLLNALPAFRNTLSGSGRQLRFWLQEEVKKDTFMGRNLSRLLGLARIN